jgi:AcrR family transcriptional regulator
MEPMDLEQRPDDWSAARPATAAPADAPRSARREATRQRLLDAARTVFAERGAFGATVEEICDRAGYTRGAFYSNFADMDDVLDALIEREHARLLEHLDASVAVIEREMATVTDLTTALGGFVDRIARTVPLDRQLSLVLTELEILAIRRPDQASRFAALSERFRERIGAFIDDAMRRNGLEPVVAPSDIADAVLAIAERSARRAFLVGDGDPDALSSAVLPGLLLGLSRPAATARGDVGP